MTHVHDIPCARVRHFSCPSAQRAKKFSVSPRAIRDFFTHVSIRLRSSVSARSSSDAMTYTPTPMAPFTHDLEANSFGSAGRRLIHVITSTGLDTLGHTRPMDLGRALQAQSPETADLVGRYLEAAVHDRRLTSLAMVAVTPVVTRVAIRSVGVGITEEFSSELRCQLLEHLPVVTGIAAPHRATRLARLAVGAARRATRVPSCRPDVVVLDDAHDRARAAAEETHSDVLLDALGEALLTSTTNDEARIICASRGGEQKIRELAEEFGTTQKALLQRRRRAEAKVRAAIRLAVAK